MSRPAAALVCGALTLPAVLTTALPAHAVPSDRVAATQAEPRARRDIDRSAAQPFVPRPSPATEATTPPTDRTFVSRVTASSSPVKDSDGNVWGPRPVTFGTWKRSSGLVGQDIRGTTDDVLYQHAGWDLQWYRLKVPARGAYQVRLLMAEPRHSAAGRRVFDVHAEGRPVVRGVDIAKAVGHAAAHQVTFRANVTDGQLDLDFVKVTDTPLVSAIEVTSLRPVPPLTETRPEPLVPVSPTSFYHADISKAPLASNSAAIVRRLAGEVRDHYNGVAAFNAFQYNASVVRADRTTPRVRVGFWDCQKKGYVPRGLFEGPRHFVDVPIPPHAVPATGNDAQLTVYAPDSDQVWEFWKMRKDSASNTWSACWGGRIDDVSTSEGIFEKPYGVSAAGLLMAPGAISLDDFARGRIDHAMYLAVMAPAKWDRFSWPANRSDGNSTDENAIREGQRLRLDPTLDVTTLGMTPVGEMVARAAQRHGFVVADKAGAVSVITESGNVRAAAEGTNPWKSLLAGPTYDALQNFPWDRMQVLPVDYGRP